MKKNGDCSFAVKVSICIVFTVGILFPLILQATDIDTIIFQGADYLYKEDLENARKNFELAVKLDPKNEFAHNKLGIVYAKLNKFDNAFYEFLYVTKLDNQNTYAHKWLGILHLKKGEMNKAFERFNTIIKIDPNNADAYYFLGAIYNFRHNQKKAIEYLKKARDAASQEADTHYRLAKAFHNVEMVDNALLEYLRALEIKPTYTKALNEIGWIYYNSGQPMDAVTYWKATLKINSKDRDAIFNLAKAYNDMAQHELRRGKKDNAKSYWKKTLAISPKDKAAKYYLKKY